MAVRAGAIKPCGVLHLSVVLWCAAVVCCFRLAPTSEWDTAAADIIVREAGGVVLQAGKVTGKGELLEDWQVS
jgi:fructose-1,6-bisphosphatase/inositol monophosphatase family enzyme